MNMLPTHLSAYDDDYFVWLAQQALLLRERQFDRLDLNQLIMELDNIMGALRHELHSRMRVLIMHLLKCHFQAERKSGSWLGTISTQRSEIRLLFKRNPSLRRFSAEAAEDVYQDAVRIACDETGLPKATFPSALPYTVEQLLDPDFKP